MGTSPSKQNDDSYKKVDEYKDKGNREYKDKGNREYKDKGRGNGGDKDKGQMNGDYKDKGQMNGGYKGRGNGGYQGNRGHYNIEEVINKANRYSSLGAIKLQDKGIVGGVFKAFLHGFWAFIKHYIIKLGFLDGGSGFVIAFGNFEGTFYRYLKLTETQKKWEAPSIKPINKIKL